MHLVLSLDALNINIQIISPISDIIVWLWQITLLANFVLMNINFCIFPFFSLFFSIFFPFFFSNSSCIYCSWTHGFSCICTCTCIHRHRPLTLLLQNIHLTYQSVNKKYTYNASSSASSWKTIPHH